MLDWSKYPNFSQDEFEYPGSPKMKHRFMKKLQTARYLCTKLCEKEGYPEVKFVINSGARDPEKNRRVGGKPDSTHLYGCACDIKYVTSREAFFIVKSLMLAGFTRIFIGANFIHVDDGEFETEIDKDPHVLFHY